MATFSLQGMIDWAVAYCNAPNVGYSMTMEYRNMGLKDGYITCFDCSSFTFFAIWLGGGFDVGTLGYPTDLEKYKTMHGQGGYNAWNVTGMTLRLPKIGFEKLPYVPDIWQTGDILVKTHQHTEICYVAPRRTMGAHREKNTALADQVSIISGNAEKGYYDEIWRYTGDDSPVVPPPPDPFNPPDPGGDGRAKRLPIWMMTKPWWKV